MKYVLIAPCGEELGPLFVGLREFPTEKIYLLCEEGHEEKTKAVAKELEKFINERIKNNKKRYYLKGFESPF